MEKSYDSDLAKLMSEARDLFKTANYADSARKYLSAAKMQESNRGLEQARDLYHEAIKNYIRASEENKEKKRYRASAENLYEITKIYQHLGADEDRIAATRAAVEDLFNAAQEYFMWNEYERGILLVATASFLLFDIKEFDEAESQYHEYMSKIQNDPTFTRAQQVLYSVGYAIKALQDIDTEALLNAQQLIGSHLIPGLNQLKADMFIPGIEKGINMVMEEFRSKIKLPKIIPELHVSRDLVLNEPKDLTIKIINEGEGSGLDLNLELKIPEEIEILDGNVDFQLDELKPGEEVEHKITFRCMSATGDIEYEIKANLTFLDQLQTKQSMLIGPYSLYFREKSLSKQLGEQLDTLSEKLTKYIKELEKIKIIPQSSTELFSELISSKIQEAESNLKEEEFEVIKANISTIKALYNKVDVILSDKFLEPIYQKREEEIQEKIKAENEKLREELNEQKEKEISEKVEEAKERLKERLTEEFTDKIQTLKNSHSEELSMLQTEYTKEKEKELQELMNELEEKHKLEIQRIKEETKKEMEQELEKQKKKLESEKQKELEEQETLLREEFQKQLSEAQSRTNSK